MSTTVLSATTWINLSGWNSGMKKMYADSSKFHKQMNTVQFSLSKMALGLGVGFSVFKGFDAIKDSISKASDLQETLSKVGAVFGDQTDSIVANADKMAKAFGLPKQELLDSSAAFGLLGKASGFDSKATAELSKEMGNLSADVASFFNIPVGDALNKLRSGLVGEAEPMRALGVLMSADAVEAEALRMKLLKQGETLTEGMKVQARASLITRGLADAQGDLERTAGSTSNQARKFQGTIANLAVEFGTTLLPAVNSGISLLNDFGGFLVEAFDKGKGSIESWGQSVATTFDTVGGYFRNSAESIAILGLIFDSTIENMNAKWNWFGETFTTIGKWFSDNWTTYFINAFKGIFSVFKDSLKIMKNVAVGSFKAMFNPEKGWDNFQEEDVFGNMQKAMDTQFTELKLPEMPVAQGFNEQQMDTATGLFGKIGENQRAFDASKPKPPDPNAKKGVLQPEVDKSVSTFAASFKEAVKTPFEKFNDIVGKLTKSKDAGLITQDEFEKKGLPYAAKESGLNDNTAKFSGAQELGSTDAYSTIISAMTGKVSGFVNMEKSASQQLAVQKKIADNIKNLGNKSAPVGVGLGN